MSTETKIDPLDAANANEPLTERYGRYDGIKFLRPAYYPDTEVTVVYVNGAFIATLSVSFGGQDWRCDGSGYTPREAVQSLHRVLSALGR